MFLNSDPFLRTKQTKTDTLFKAQTGKMRPNSRYKNTWDLMATHKSSLNRFPNILR